MDTEQGSPSPSSTKKKHHAHPHQESLDDVPATVPWFPSPLEGWNEEAQCFAPRHEASTLELFFDLWFVANLATFTQYHAITNRYTFWSYVAFFIVLWTSWFHIVCFDARFASDSVWERSCKIVHFCSFAAFALAGYKFAPVARNVQDATPHWIYRVLCFALLLSRAWLALQYLVTAIRCSSRKHRSLQLTLSLMLNALLFSSVAAIFAGLFAGFRHLKTNLNNILIGLYIAIILEFFGTLLISIMWRKLSFKASHIGERLGLLGLIIIGEGVIGTTKTITRTMGKNGPTIGASAQIFCAILILVFMWILYFDRVPKYRFGAVKQQLWMALHLPFHLAILGVVEGSQQLAQARYIYSCLQILLEKVQNACIDRHLDSYALASDLNKTIEYFKITESARGTLALKYVNEQIYLLGNTTGVCSLTNTTLSSGNELLGVPVDFVGFFNRAIGAMVQALEIDIPAEDDRLRAFNVALETWSVVYTYFWSAIILLLLCYTITSLLADHAKSHSRAVWHYANFSILSRSLMNGFAIAMLVVGRRNFLFLQSYIASAWILPSVVIMLWIICMSDRGWKVWRHRRTKRYDGVPVSEVEREDEDFEGGIRRRGTNAHGYPLH